MNMHQEICLASKGWKQVADRADQSDYFWAPSGWFRSSARGTWYWKGQPVYETNEQYRQDSEECSKAAGIANTQKAPRDQMEVWFACMWKRDWRKEPVRQEQPAVHSSETLIYWRPSGWVTAPPGTKKIDWMWQGPPAEEEAALKRFQRDKEGCKQDMGISDQRTSTTSQGEAFMACMWGKKWGAEPISP
jgi:hypothetical protein